MNKYESCVIMIKRLNELPINNIGIINDINTNDSFKRRILNLGIVKGSYIKPLYKAILKDPTAYLVKNSVIALREEDAKNIMVKTHE